MYLNELHQRNLMNGVIMDNKNIETFEEIDKHIDGVVVYLLKKFAVKSEFSPKFDAELKEETEA